MYTRGLQILWKLIKIMLMIPQETNILILLFRRYSTVIYLNVWHASKIQPNDKWVQSFDIKWKSTKEDWCLLRE